MHRKPMSVKSRGNTPSYSKFPEENPYTQANKVIKKELDKDKKVKKIVISQQLQG